MFQKLFLPLCLICTVPSFAQVGITPAKTTENQANTPIDYRIIGTPMPPLTLVIPADTTKVNKPASDENESKGRRRKKHDRDEEISMGGHAKSVITDQDLDNGANLIVMMFNPTCSHCEEQTLTFIKNSQLFKRTKLVLLANKGMRAYIPDFVRGYKTYEHPFIYVGIDSSGFNENAYMYKALPQINIYGRDRKLMKYYNGQVSIDSLAKYIE